MLASTFWPTFRVFEGCFLRRQGGLIRCPDWDSSLFHLTILGLYFPLDFLVKFSPQRVDFIQRNGIKTSGLSEESRRSFDALVSPSLAAEMELLIQRR